MKIKRFLLLLATILCALMAIGSFGTKELVMGTILLLATLCFGISWFNFYKIVEKSEEKKTALRREKEIKQQIAEAEHMLKLQRIQAKAERIAAEEREAERKVEEDKKKESLKASGIWMDFANVNLDDIVVLDLETTGTNPRKDEVLQVSIINANEEVLFSNYVKPPTRKSWPDAQKIHGITPGMVKDLDPITAYKDTILSILANKIIVGYNVEFDLEFLAASRILSSINMPSIDLMKPFSEIYGEYSEYYGDYTFQSLAKCAEYYGYQWSGNAHNSLEDCRATLFCFKKMRGI